MDSKYCIRAFCLSVFVASIHFGFVATWYTVYRFIVHGITDPIGLVLGSFLVFITFVPLEATTWEWSKKFIRYTCQEAGLYFPTTVKVEDPNEFRKGRPYVVGFEPHSSLPVGIPIVFSSESPLLPEALRGCSHGLASSICFMAPFVRHLWWWLGLRCVKSA